MGRALRLGIAILALAALPLTLMFGCSASERHEQNQEPTQTVEEDFSVVGIDRVIPLRFAFLKKTSGSVLRTLAQLEDAVQAANLVYRPAGVQFYIRAVDEYVVPHIADWTGGNCAAPQTFTWSSTLDTEFRQVVPSMPANPFPTAQPARLVSNWAGIVGSLFLPPSDEILVWTAEGGCGSAGIFPWEGKSMLMTASDIVPGTFAHEMGHHLGLVHTWDAFPGVTDPETGATFTIDDAWDLIYGFTSPPTFFANRTEAAAFAGTKRPINLDNVNCSQDCNCTVSCNLATPGGGSSTIRTGDPGASGIAFKFVGDNPPTAYRRGVNVEVYFGCPTPGVCYRNGISTSQVRMVRKFLRFRTQQLPTSVFGADGSTKSTDRDLLGTSVFGREPAYRLDFDADGRRDIAVFRPPTSPGATGSFRIKKSSGSYAATTVINFGTLGDVPVPADYDGDGKTDVAVWRTMGLTGNDLSDKRGLWVICPSATSTTSCPSPVTIYWGERDDIPLPGTNFDGLTSTGELAIYRRSDRSFRWIVQPYTPGTGVIKTFSAPVAGEKPAVPMVALLEGGDAKSDPILFRQVNSDLRFTYRLSTGSWNTETTRTFPGAAPASSGGPDAQASPFPVRAHTTYLTAKRQVFSVWDPYTANFLTMWDPMTSTVITPCWWGAPGDIPIGTDIDLNNDGKADRIVHRIPTDSTPVQFFIDSDFSVCNGTSLGYNLPNLSKRAMMFSSMDASGDGKPDLWALDPDTMVWTYFKSQQSFSTQATIQLGETLDVPL